MALTLARVCLMGEGIKCVLLLISDRKCSHQTKGPQKSFYEISTESKSRHFCKTNISLFKMQCNPPSLPLAKSGVLTPYHSALFVLEW